MFENVKALLDKSEKAGTPAMQLIIHHGGKEVFNECRGVSDENGTPFPREARMVLLCRQMYAGRLQKDCFLDPAVIDTHYPQGDYHQMYVCEIERVLLKED